MNHWYYTYTLYFELLNFINFDYHISLEYKGYLLSF